MDTKIRRLRQQKKLWFEKMIHVVRYRISSVEELEYVKYEEAEYKAKCMINDRPPSATSLDYGVLAGN
jgi:hypothetical protein